MKPWPTVEDGWDYARDVIAGKIVTSKMVQLECKRMLDDYNNQDKLSWVFDKDYAQHIIDFCVYIPHVKGHWATNREPIRPEPWQVFLLSMVYGWRSKTNLDVRRFRTVLTFIARKNGKSFLCAVISLYELLYGDEGGEIYSVATKSAQAKLVWQMSADIIRKLRKEYKDMFKTTVSTISVLEKNSRFKYLGRDSDSEDGHNPSAVIVDEGAAITDRNVIEVMESGMGARLSPLLWYITTAGFSKQTKFHEQLMYYKQVLEGIVKDERIFGLAYYIEDQEDYTDPENWIKANPNLGVSVFEDWLSARIEKSKTIAADRNEVLVKSCNIFTSSAENWIPPHEWEACEVDTPIREGELYIGMDLSQTRDLTALAAVWANPDGDFFVEWKCFLPRKSLQYVPSHYRTLYDLAIKNGTLILTSSDVVDYEEVKQWIFKYAKDHQLEMLGYDNYNAGPLVGQLTEERIPNVAIGQGVVALTDATKQTERFIANGRMRHIKDPFIDWQLENCTLKVYPNENVHVQKGEDTNQKIDAIVAMLMAVAMSASEDKPTPLSVTVVNF